jgi:transcriptional regulator with XRE-family HTH domain
MTGAEFRQLRRLAELTQEQAARELDVTQRTILRWEHGDTRICTLRSEAIRARLLRIAFGPVERKITET